MEYMTEQDTKRRERDLVLFAREDGTEVGVRIREIDLKDLVLGGGGIPGTAPDAEMTPEDRIESQERGLDSVCRAGIVLPEGFATSPAWATLAFQYKQKIANAIADLSGFGGGEDAPKADTFPAPAGEQR